MGVNESLQLFQEKKIRTAWDDQQEKWYFSVVDVIEVLTDSTNPQTYLEGIKKEIKRRG